MEIARLDGVGLERFSGRGLLPGWRRRIRWRRCIRWCGLARRWRCVKGDRTLAATGRWRCREGAITAVADAVEVPRRPDPAVAAHPLVPVGPVGIFLAVAHPQPPESPLPTGTPVLGQVRRMRVGSTGVRHGCERQDRGDTAGCSAHPGGCRLQFGATPSPSDYLVRRYYRAALRVRWQFSVGELVLLSRSR